MPLALLTRADEVIEEADQRQLLTLTGRACLGDEQAIGLCVDGDLTGRIA
jgi:hypothetical protein